jgi:hypothetical protein
MRDPLAVDLLGDAQAALIESVDDFANAADRFARHLARRNLRTPFECSVDERFQNSSRSYDSMWVRPEGRTLQNVHYTVGASIQSAKRRDERHAHLAATGVYAVRISRQILTRQHRHVR